MSGTLTVSRRLPSKQVKPNPPQVPIEERAGVHMSRDLWDVFRGDSLNRDVFSVDSRIREWEETEELHMRNMESPLQVNTVKLRLPPYGIHLLAGDMGAGKCLGEGVPVLMFDGSVKPVEGVRTGDTLMGPDSKPRVVLNTTQGRSPMYCITPTKGEPWTCNDVHMLTLIRTNEHHSKPQRGGEIVDVPLNEYLEWSSSEKVKYLQFRVAVDFSTQPSPPVEPSLLGLLLEDDSLIYDVSTAPQDAEIVEYKAVTRTGFTVEPIGEGDYYGFTLDGDGRFLLGDFTVTHNTLTVAWMAREYYRAGWPVYSTAGFLFGQRLRIEEAYSFPDAVNPGSFVFADEIHAMLDRYSSNSVRSRTFGQATTAMRKEHVTCVGASANSNMVDWSFRGASECVLVPRRWYPPRGRKLHAPPFCYLEISKMYPFPYRRRDPLLMDGGLLKGTEVKIATWRPSPVELMASAKLIDSFEAVRLGENFGIDAAAMRKLREDKEGGGGLGEDNGESGEPSNRLLVVIKRAYETGYLKTEGTIALTTIRDVLKQSGLKTVTATAIKSALEMTGCEVTTRSVEAEELADLFASIDL